MSKALLVITVTLAMSACWNGENIHVNMGDVSFGQQLIDLKAALDAGAISQAEYDRVKERMLALTTLCENTDEDERDGWHGERREHDHRQSREHDREADEDSGFKWF